ncbi:putative F0F1-ATPase subunit (Ca2+/Mg2+ transporter) [Scopulibacillus darangshiensis]|uniref:Putative F0F1-ATPase subunit (Ca2+/Mg2+ transporter) n=1 Tax=Scopulibacillus darangshiensis TaxID=442528 RepID=A0A4R2NGC1_9BACL|nr:AtpZ/AtpI family protein [Scopulibacillus darangshiensis]TCP20252.1 putative F0F1-ATPase subunit (Ca2+/Mg2+ transporter) [Scopulibacillus darangshiensis]
MKKNTNDPWRMVGLVGTLGFEILAFILGGIWLGKRMDESFGTAPLWLAVGIIGGLLIGIASAVFTLISFTKD